MHGRRVFLIVILLLSYGAVGARQPAVRSALPLPVPAGSIATALGLPSADTATLLLHAIRLAYGEPDKPGSPGDRRRAKLQQVLWAPGDPTTDSVPLPLDPSIWRETLLQTKVADDRFVAAILADRRAALLYHGLFALDDDTLAWLGPDRDTLLHLREHAGLFAAFGRSIHVRAGRVVVPGGDEAEPLWESLIGVSPSKPAAFVQRMFDGDGWSAFLYDTVAHIGPAQQRFALGLQLQEPLRFDRLRKVLAAFVNEHHAWQPEHRPFSRPPFDAAVVLSTLAVTKDGEPAGPMSRWMWEQVFHADDRLEAPLTEVSSSDVPRDAGSVTVDAAWIASRTAGVPDTLGRRRLDAMLFAQRVFADEREADPAVMATALRGFASFPALMLTLERLGTTQPAAYVRAAEHARTLSTIESEPARRTAIAQFQGVLGIIERARRSGTLTDSAAHGLVSSLCALEVTGDNGYDGRLARWLRTRFARSLPGTDDQVSIEAAVLNAMAGPPTSGSAGVIEWEGRRYRVDPADAELRRLRSIRLRLGGPGLDQALQAAGELDERSGRAARQAADEKRLADALASLVYAAHLGDANGQAVTTGNAALRHDFGIVNVKTEIRWADAWRLPAEDVSARGGWRVRGSLLGLEAALGRLALKRLDPSSMMSEPRLATADRQMVALTVALLNPFAMSDSARDEIAAALGRGRARAAALSGDPADLDAVAKTAGLSEWRRQALAWTFSRDRARAREQFSLVELFWLGSPRPSAIRSLDAWGAAVLPLTGCLCLRMPAARPWEEVSGRQATGLLGTRAADVALQVADTLAALQLPASLAPFVLGFAMQDVAEQARPAYPDDWDEFERAALDLTRDRLTGYVTALTAGGPLVLADPASGH
jgi:hypothetical protein